MIRDPDGVICISAKMGHLDACCRHIIFLKLRLWRGFLNVGDSMDAGWQNELYFGDNLDILREQIASRLVSLTEHGDCFRQSMC